MHVIIITRSPALRHIISYCVWFFSMCHLVACKCRFLLMFNLATTVLSCDPMACARGRRQLVIRHHQAFVQSENDVIANMEYLKAVETQCHKFV